MLSLRIRAARGGHVCVDGQAVAAVRAQKLRCKTENTEENDNGQDGEKGDENTCRQKAEEDVGKKEKYGKRVKNAGKTAWKIKKAEKTAKGEFL